MAEVIKVHGLFRTNVPNGRTIIAVDFMLTPALLLAMWAAGAAGIAALVAYWRIVGPGYVWLTASVVAGIGVGAWFFDHNVGLLAGVVLSASAVVLGRKPVVASALLAASAASFLVFSVGSGSPLLAVSGSLALGGITAEMLLGHWYLVSPQMPRWALQRLDIMGAAGIAIDAVLLVAFGALVGAGTASVVAFGALASMSLLLMVAVWFSLKQPSYPGVMAATGLSYLAVLTSFGAVALGRALLDVNSNASLFG